MELLLEFIITIASLLKPIYMILNLIKGKELPEVLTIEYLEGKT